MFEAAGIKSSIFPLLKSVLSGKEFPELVFILFMLFGATLFLRVGLLFFDGVLSAFLRRRLQENIFRQILSSDWASMRGFRVGDAVGTNTQEAMVVSKYLSSVVNAGYCVIAGGVFGLLALLASFHLTMVLCVIALPLIIMLRKVFSVQARTSRNAAVLRNEFSSDIADRFGGLFQIHVDRAFAYHFSCGVRTQKELTKLEVKIAACQALIGSFNLLLPFSVLAVLLLGVVLFDHKAFPDLTLLASVGVLGLKTAGQLNSAIAAFGNLSRLSGSLYPVLSALNLASARTRKPIPEAVIGLEAVDISFSYGERAVVEGFSMSANVNQPVVLGGESGKGKTTIANLLAGLYIPNDGEVNYIGKSGGRYSTRDFVARVGYVVQDIYLFRGTLRENLTSGRTVDEHAIWSVLEDVGAADFVRQLGGLEMESSEAGRSLSGGQRRRLGVARVLLMGAEVLIFDEATAGLDQENRMVMIGLISRLSQRYAVVVVSHDPIALPGQIACMV